MAKIFDAEEVAKHNTAESCWVILYGDVYDVTDFVPSHPGGSRIILKLAGRDATEEYDPVHPPGTLEENLKPEAKLGSVDPASLERLRKAGQSQAQAQAQAQQAQPPASGQADPDKKPPPPPLETLFNLDEIAEVAQQQVSRKCWAYYWSAGDDQISKVLNGLVYRDILLRPRVFVDCTSCDLSTTMIGNRVGTPLYVSPAAMARLAHPDGEQGIARGISSFGGLQIVSNNASQTPEQIVEGAAPGQVFGWQLYVQNDRSKNHAMLKRINALRDRYKFIVLTLDAPVPGKRELDEKQQFIDTGMTISAAASTGPKRPGGGGVGQQLFWGTAADLTWSTTLPWLTQHTDLPVVLKGIQTHEDAYIAAQYAAKYGTVKAIILSNHGGRALDTAPPAVHTLLEIRKYCPEVFDHIEVWVDGGIRRGTDVIKALCLGAKAVGIGRAALYGLGAGGWKGVERTFEILNGEMETCMKLLGAKTVQDLGPHFINSRKVERDIFDGPAGLDGLQSWAKAKL